VGQECRAVRNAAGFVDTTGFSRYEISGPNARTWLDRLFAGKLPEPGRARLAPMLGHDGRLKGDLTIFNWGEGIYWIMGSYYLRQWHMRWFNDHAADGVTVRDISDSMAGFLLTGPRSREVLARVTHQDVSRTALPFMACADLQVGLVDTKAARLSIAGELGFELNCSAADHATLRETLLAAGRDLGLVEVGFYALNALRLEKSFGIWSAEFRQSYTPAMTGLDRWIDFDKPVFNGRNAALRARVAKPASILATLEIDAVDADASGFEPVWSGGKRVGFVTSGGYGHTIGKSLALALIDPAQAAIGTELTVHVVGVERSARVITPSPYDPTGQAMRR
jgi:dimethylglycine dehydrogenase